MIRRSIPWTDPVAAFAPWANTPHAVLLDSATTAPGLGGRFSCLAVAPFRVITADDTGTRIDGVPVAGDPFQVLARELTRFPLAADPACPVPFRTGAVGYLGYDLGRHLEHLPPPPAWGLTLPDMVMGLYDVVAVFDHLSREAWVMASGFPEQEAAARKRRAEARAARMETWLAGAPPPEPPPGRRPGPVKGHRPLETGGWVPDITAGAYRDRINEIKAYINAGDIFQANFTQGFSAALPANQSSFMIYQRLRTLSPAPYGAFLCCGEHNWLACASPEQFLGLTAAGQVVTCPIKGTRPRGLTPADDQAQRQALAASSKDRAENLMITDLLRNDLGRVCRIGSITVPRRMEPVTFAAVHHLVSEVRGQLRPGLGPVDVLRAAFPGGSITGAPKIRAMEIIAAMEPRRRGPYCGAIAWIGFDGAMDSNIIIRTLVGCGDTVLAQAGGGITAPSDPDFEYEELLTKVRPLLAAVVPPAHPEN